MTVSRFALSFAVVMVAGAAAAQGPSRGPAEPYRAGQTEVLQPWIRATPNGAPTAAGYMTIVNRGRTPDRLVSASSVLAQRVEIHQMSMAGGVMRMREVSGGVPIGPGQTVIFSTSGDHLMLIGPTRAFRAGEQVPVTLNFARAGALTAEFDVRQDAPPAAGGMRMP
jgi:copper(I)-binding protein